MPNPSEIERNTFRESDLPAWANWYAMDADGRWFWYERQPFTCDEYPSWMTSDSGDLAGPIPDYYAPTTQRHWRESLTQVKR